MMDIFANRKREQEQSLVASHAAAQTTGNDLQAMLERARSAEERALRNELAALPAQLAQAETALGDAEDRQTLAEAALARQQPNPTSETILKVQSAQQARSAAVVMVAQIRQRMTELQRQVGAMSGAAELAVKRQRVAQLWAPPLEALLPAVRALLPLLREQHAAFVTLDIEHIYGLIPGGGGYESKLDIAGTLTHWISEAENALAEMKQWTEAAKSGKSDK